MLNFFIVKIKLSNGGNNMIEILSNDYYLIGSEGSIRVNGDDEITLRLAMLYEGECEGKGRTESAKKFKYSRQRYYQILKQYEKGGAEALKSFKRGPKNNYRRTDEVVRQVIRHRFLDPNMTPEVISQKLTQCGHPIGIRSVERVISDYGLQKKSSILIIPTG